MSAPIRREDIREGDRVRLTREFTAGVDYAASSEPGGVYELIERPVVLPTEPGAYATNTGSVHVLTSSGQWLDFSMWNGTPWVKPPTNYAPLTRLEFVADTAKKVLDRVLEEYLNGHTAVFLPDMLPMVAKEFGGTEDRAGQEGEL